VITGRLAHGAALPLWLWLVPLIYVAVPALAGSVIGSATADGKWWTRYVAGRSPAPRAWVHQLYAHDHTGRVRLKMKDNAWIVGAYAQSDNGRLRSYAAGYPSPQDLYLVETVECEPATGAFVVDANDRPIPRGMGVLVRWDEVMYLEFIDSRPGG